MTNREFYQSVIEANISEDTTIKATELLSALDARNEKRKSSESKEKKEVAARRESVLAALTNTPTFADTIAENTGLTVGQVRSALAALVRDGIADKLTAKVDKATKMAYVLHVAE